MIDYTQYLIPNLKFNKVNNSFIFKSENGTFICPDGHEFNICNISITINDNILISFLMDTKDYAKYDSGELNDETPFPQFKEIHIKTISEEYELLFTNFTQCCSNVGPMQTSVCGTAIHVVIKNSSHFSKESKINVWIPIESNNIAQSCFNKFNFINSPDIFLKSITYENCDEELFTEDYLEKEQKSFSRLLDESSFLFYKAKYKNKSLTSIEVIENLLKFFDSNISHLRMKIIQEISTNNFEIQISSKNTTNLNGKPIFSNCESNFFNFINSAYGNYFNSKSQKINVNIDLLLHYYALIKNDVNPIIKIILSSEFMEIYKNSFSNESKNERFKIFKRLQKHRFPQLHFDTIKVLRFLQPDISILFEEVRNEFIGKNNQDFIAICNKFEESYISAIINFHRNKIIHSGEFILNVNHIYYFIKWWKQNLDKDFKGVSEEIINNVSNSIEEKLKFVESLFDVDVQSRFMEYLIEIILLMILDVDCELIKEDRFKTVSEGDISYSSKNYIKQFKK